MTNPTPKYNMWTCPTDKRVDSFPGFSNLPPEAKEALQAEMLETEFTMSDETLELMKAFSLRPAKIDNTIIYGSVQ